MLNVEFLFRKCSAIAWYRTLSHTCEIGISHLCIVIQKARKITCPVGENYLPNWGNKKVLKKRTRKHRKTRQRPRFSHDKAFQKTRVMKNKTPSLETSRFVKRNLAGGRKKIMNQNMKAFIRYLIVAICSAIVTFLSSSCTAGLVIGKNQRQHQENNISTKVDSTYYVPTITIR